jgi:signal transduction histidine kinase/CheY-like chemotaxis protein
VQDITARRQAEEALKDINQTLEQKVTAEVAERRRAEEALRQSRKLESMGQLTGGVAHDFNNLLTPIIGSLDLLQRRKFGDERVQRHIDGALQSAERAKTLVQRLLAFARRQPLQATSVDLEKSISGMSDLIASTVGPRVRLEIELEEDLPFIGADQNQLEMALLNLTINARDAMPEGGTLRIAAAVRIAASDDPLELPAGRYVLLSISDTGQGMDEDTQVRAIEPFFSTKGIGRGTGLGLSMVHGLAAQLGGALTIQSRLGEGTSVELWLPLANLPPQELTDAAAMQRSNAVGLAVVVDDEDLVRASISGMLDELGYKVVELSSAEDALAELRKGLPAAVVVTDHLMPNMTGTELASRLSQERPGLPVLIIPGYAEDAGIDPAVPRLTKPFRQAELASKLSELVQS